MTLRSLLVTIVVGLVLVAPVTSAFALEPVTVESDLRFPAGIAFDSAGTMFVTEREGRILSFTNGERRVVATIPTITQGETGLLGIALSPDDRYVYAFATEHDQTNTIWRASATGGEPERVITGLPGGVYHNGGGLAFGPDGNLYVSNGEKHDTGLAQDPNALGGKVYRFTADGGIPSENPFGDSPVWSLGHRNPFGLAVDPLTGDVFVTENGPEAFDEINRIEAGANYGWPIVYGPASEEETRSLRGRYVDPLLAYEDIIVPTGITFADPFNAIASVAGDMFFGTYGDQTIHRVVMDRQRTRVIEDVIWYRSGEPIVALAWGPRGLYYSTPGAVRLFELARRDDRPRDPEDPSATPTAAATGVDDPLDEAPVGLLLVGGAAAVLAGALLYAFGGKSSGRKRRGRT